MTRPLTENKPINKALSCMISEDDMSKLGSMSYTTGFSKSEVIRHMIRFSYIFINDIGYQVRCEEEKSGKRYSMEELRDKLIRKIEDEYLKFFDPNTLKDGDMWVRGSESDVFTKMHKHTGHIISDEKEIKDK